MKFRAALVVGAVLVVSWLMPPAYAQSGNVSPRQLVVSKVTPNLAASPATILIEGDNFGLSPSVEMGAAGGGLLSVGWPCAAQDGASVPHARQ